MMYSLKIEIDGLPLMSNQLLRLPWYKSAGNTKIWKQSVFTKVWHKKPESPLMQARLKLTRCSTRRPDYDGLVSSFKPIIDGLVQAKVLAGDSHEFIGIPEYLWEKAKQKTGKVIIEVSEHKDL